MEMAIKTFRICTLKLGSCLKAKLFFFLILPQLTFIQEKKKNQTLTLSVFVQKCPKQTFHYKLGSIVATGLSQTQEFFFCLAG